MGASVGIRPKADGENIVLTDTHRDLVDDVTATTDEFGTVLGEGINEIYATAQSANDSAQELAGRVKALEDRAVVVTDSAGRIQAADPVEPGDVATKRYVDQTIEDLPAQSQRSRPLVLSGSRTTNGWVKFTAPDGVRTTTSAVYPPAGTYLALVETRGAAATSFFRFAKTGDATDLQVGEQGRTFATISVTPEHWVQFWAPLSGVDPATVTVTLLPI